jgi:hypothetical protein
MKKYVFVLVLAILMGGAAFAEEGGGPNFLAYPGIIKGGDFLISPAFRLGTGYYSGLGIAVTVGVDYALDIPFPLIVGGEVGFATITGSGDLSSIPFFAKASYNPNLGVEKLNVYVDLKLGYNISLTSGVNGGFSYGLNGGARYFFGENMGVFGELGYNYYTYSVPVKTWWYSTSATGFVATYLAVGITFKF